MDILKTLLPKKLYLWYKDRHFRHLRKKSTEEVFAEIYRDNTWGGEKGSFHSGAGTSNPNTHIYIEQLVKFISENNIRSVLEIGCGDFTIMQQVLSQVQVAYTGGDVVEALIQHHQATHQDAQTHFIQLNAIKDSLPAADLVIIRQVLQHLSNEQILQILPKLNNFRYALITEHVPVTADLEYNLDKISGPHIRMRINSGVFIDKPPFNVQHVQTLFEYREDDKVKNRMVPAVMRTCLVKN